jgi:hypothetical protein
MRRSSARLAAGALAPGTSAAAPESSAPNPPPAAHAATASSDPSPPAGPLNAHTFFTDSVMPVLGGALLLLSLPYLAVQVALCTAWHALDACTVRLAALAARVSRWRGFERLVLHEGDGFIAAAWLWLGVCIPAVCVHEALHARAHGFSVWRAVAFNLLRIGPMYANFAHSYTLCHKEYHAFGGVFKAPLNRAGARYAFNWVAGPFFGVLPGTFTHSHIYNHHKYDNGVSDVYSTGGYARDSLWNFCRYLFVWFAYASNASTIAHFLAEGRVAWALQVAGCTAYWLAIVGVFWAIHPGWACASILCEAARRSRPPAQPC